VARILIRQPSLPTITWTQQSLTGGPGFSGFHSIHYDSVSEQVLIPGVLEASSSIYDTDWWAYDTLTNTFTHLGGNGSLSNLCDDGGGVYPPDRHPYQQVAIDTTRNVLRLFGGVCATEPDRTDVWQRTLTSDPSSGAWSDVTPAGGVPTMVKAGAMVYCPNADVDVVFGPNSGTFWEVWVRSPTTDTLTANQIAAGCVTAGRWAEVFPSGMPSSAFSQGPQAIYDPDLGVVQIFAGLHGSGAYGGIRARHQYAPLTQTWTTLAPSLLSEPESGSAEMPIARLSWGEWDGQYLYHQTSHTTASSATPADYLMNPTTGALTAIETAGGGPARICFLIADPSAERIVACAYGAGNDLQVWHGVLS
jgi:hypothetical protein